MRRLAIGITKGGCGKTATACHLAHGLARDGHRVLLVDADDQDQARLYFGVQPDTGLDSVALGRTAWKDAAVEVRPGLKLLAAGSGLDGIATWMAREDHAVSALRDQLPSRGFDFVIVDTAPGWGPVTISALLYVQELLAPVSMELQSVHGLLAYQRKLERIKKATRQLALRYVLPTFFDRRVKKSKEILGMLRQHYGQECLEPIRYSVRISEAPGFGQTVYEYAPRSTGAEDYERLSKEVSRV